MAAASSPLSSSLSTTSSLSHLISNPHRPSHPPASSISVRSPLPSRFHSPPSLRLRLRLPPLPSLSNGSGDIVGEHNEVGVITSEPHGVGVITDEPKEVGDDRVEPHAVGDNGGGDDFGGGGGGGDEGDGEDESGGEENGNEALIVLANLGRSLDNLPMDLAEAARDGKINGEIIMRFVSLENSPLFKWLLHFGAFRERLLADDIFLSKLLMECGIGLFTKVNSSYPIPFY